MVSEEFEGKPLLARHRMVNALFAEEMKGKMHGERLVPILSSFQGIIHVDAS